MIEGRGETAAERDAATDDDASLVARCRAGDEAAWSLLVERYSRYVYAIAMRAFRLSETDAEEVFQEVFARAFQHLPQLRDDAAIRPWLAQTTRRLAIDHLRRAGRVEPVGGEEELGGDSASGEDMFERLDEALAVREAMAELPDGCQEILDRFFARDESYRTISAALDIPQGTIASRISRCLAKLRATFGQAGRNDGDRASG